MALKSIALALFVLILPSLAWAGDIFKFRGESASAFFESTEGCVTTFVSVFASDDVFQSPPGPGDKSSQAFISIFQFDNCTFTVFLDAFGSATLAKDDFAVIGGRKLNGATLNATIPVTDFVSFLSFDVTVDLTWTGTGDISRGNSHSHFQFGSPGTGGSIFNSRFNGSFRSAEASGTVSDGIINFTPEPSSFADIALVRSGDVIID